MVLKGALVATVMFVGTAAAQAPPAAPDCPARLAEVARAEPVARPRAKDRACTVPTPVRVDAVRAGDREIPLTGRPVMHCETAFEFALWVRERAAPLARKVMRRRLVALETGPGFQCRRRNRRKTGRLSEHAFGNAVDVAGFRFARGAFAVAPRRKLKRRQWRYLQAVRQGACERFTTVLGPGSNAAHANHLHFDLGRAWRNGKRRAKPYRICD